MARSPRRSLGRLFGSRTHRFEPIEPSRAPSDIREILLAEGRSAVMDGWDETYPSTDEAVDIGAGLLPDPGFYRLTDRANAVNALVAIEKDAAGPRLDITFPRGNAVNGVSLAGLRLRTGPAVRQVEGTLWLPLADDPTKGFAVDRRGLVRPRGIDAFRYARPMWLKAMDLVPPSIAAIAEANGEYDTKRNVARKEREAGRTPAPSSVPIAIRTRTLRAQQTRSLDRASCIGR